MNKAPQLDDQYIALTLEKNGQEMSANILQVLRDAHLSDLCYAYKIRVKSEEKLIEKKRRKQAEKTSYEITSITDVIGLRLVTLFKGDMAEVFRRLLTLFTSASDAINPNPFRQAPPEEVIVYVGTTAMQEFYSEIAGIAKSLYPEIEVKRVNSSEGYSSIHVVTRLEKKIENRRLGVSPYRLPIEIQIRTVFEDAWGEIDHKFGYVIREGKESGSPTRNPEHVLAHLRALKGFTDACMEYAECIRKEAVTTEIITSSGKIVSVESDREIIDRFAQLGLPEVFLDKYLEARQAREQASQSFPVEQNNRKGPSRPFLQAAELFRELGNTISANNKFDDLDPGQRLGLYYCRMNEALCLMSTNSGEQVAAAHAIYLQLEQNFPDYPLLKMRLGQSYAKLNNIEKGIEKLKECARLTDSKLGGRAASCDAVWSDAMPKADYLHMMSVRPKLLGYYLWQKSRLLPPSATKDKADLFLSAFNTTLECLKVPDPKKEFLRAIYNNLTYYSLGYLFNSRRGDSTAKVLEMEAALAKYVDLLMGVAGSIEHLDIEEHDTMMKAYACLAARGKADKSQAITAANSLMSRCLSEEDGTLDAALRLWIAQGAKKLAEGGEMQHFEMNAI